MTDKLYKTKPKVEQVKQKSTAKEDLTMAGTLLMDIWSFGKLLDDTKRREEAWTA